ncbi:hypothetical protein LTR47_006711 [Exophiala xenobiotica]|nr:hypothetical protein LTR41_007705 [Exophiala xenobiotica]KAK5232182.1 hypothetical protein LTR47_006711 [Exophiala xenobiotica]KAK5248805.1 hypothetical protein LTS06_006227 [Exophiala xenobiotica]KAK5320542.1 hypothetical protein LTR93_006754 [Exophiala xenobiotica]KAK5347374.1 hypothetical protein LTR61_008961 [Exophiala xenobiotica]
MSRNLKFAQKQFQSPSWIFSSTRPSISSMSSSFSERWQNMLAGGEHTRIPPRDNNINYGQACSQETFTYDKSMGAKVSSLNGSSSTQSVNWPLNEKYYSTTVDPRCPQKTLWRSILIPTIVIIFPMACLVGGLLGLIFGYRVKSDPSLFPEVSNTDSLRNHAVVLVNYSATRIAFVASWASTLAPLLAGFVMHLFSFQSALMMLHSSSGSGQHDLPTPYQYSLLVGLCLASTGRLGRYLSYSAAEGVVVPPVVRRAARTLSLTLLLAVIVFGADTALHYTMTTINFDRIAITSQAHAYGRGLSEQCLALNRSENFGLPCSRNGEIAESDYEAYVAGQNEIFFLQHDTSNISAVRLVTAPEQPSTSEQGKVAILTPQIANLSPYRDYSATTAGVVTICTPISSACQWTTLGPNETYSQFNCSKNFYGILGKAPTTSDTGKLLDDPDVPPLGFKPGSGLQYSYFMDEGLDTPYDSTGAYGPFLTDDQLINPVYLGIAGRFTTTAQRAGVSMSNDPGVHQGPTQNIDFVLRCQYTTYSADYSWVNSTARIDRLTPSPNGTLAEIFHGYNLVGTDSAFDNDLGDDILQAALQADPKAMADNFANSYSQRVMSVIGPFLSSRVNIQEQNRTPLLVAKVPKAPLAILVAGCIGYVIFGVASAILAYRALNDVDVRDIAARFTLAALSLHAFRDAGTDNVAVEVDDAGHRVFDETKIRAETSRVGVEGEPRDGFALKSLV